MHRLALVISSGSECQYWLSYTCCICFPRDECVRREQRRVQSPVLVQATGRVMRMSHWPGAHGRPEHVHRARSLPALLASHGHPAHLPGNQQQQRGHPAHRCQGGIGTRLRHHRQPHLLDRYHAKGEEKAGNCVHTHTCLFLGLSAGCLKHSSVMGSPETPVWK